MDQLWAIYHNDIPEFLLEFMTTKEMLRLKDVGMNCGCEYSNLKEFTMRHPYSRYDHSVGVALIIWHFTGDMKQSLAGLYHDIATPVFAHAIDFLNKDYLKQESTEDKTYDIIQNSTEIGVLLEKYGLSIHDIDNYHLYPIADNDMPRLSADRLEYTLGNLYNYGYVELDDIKRYYENISVGINEDNNKELIFNSIDIAIDFIKNAFKTFEIYVSDKDRYSMQCLADIVKYALNQNALTMENLYGCETDVIKKINSNPKTEYLWNLYVNYHDVMKYKDEPEGYFVKVDAKRRYIDPIVKDTRLSTQNNDILEKIKEFVNREFNYYMKGI